MKDPARLLDRGATGVERALLQAGAGEEPPPSGRRKLAAALGLSVGLTTILGEGSASAGTTVKAAAPIAAKWWMVVGAVAALGGGALLYPDSPVREPRVTPAERPSNAASSASAPFAVRKQRAETSASAPTAALPAPVEPAATVTAASVLVPPAAAPTPRSADTKPALAGPPSIAREIGDIDSARQRLRAGSARAALSALDDYAREYPGGVFRQEAALLRIEALVAMGQREQARRMARRFLSASPGSPHETRIAKLVGDVDE